MIKTFIYKKKNVPEYGLHHNACQRVRYFVEKEKYSSKCFINPFTFHKFMKIYEPTTETFIKI